MTVLARIILCLYLVAGVVSAQAAEYNSLVLRAQASIFPKIIMLDNDLEAKIHGNEIVLHIFYESIDLRSAIELKDLIVQQYKGSIGNYSLDIKLKEAGSNVVFGDVIPTAYLVLTVSDVLLNNIMAVASENQRIFFSYNHRDMKRYSLISLLLKEKVYIYLNKKQLSGYGIKFQPVFYKIVKVQE